MAAIRLAAAAFAGIVALSIAPAAIAGSDAADPLTAQIAERLAPRLTDGLQLKAITLACKPPPGATLKEVAPGVPRLSSPAFTVELSTPGGTLICSAQAQVERRALVAARDLGAGQEVSGNDFRPGWVDAFASPPDLVNAIDSNVTLIAPIRQGDPVSASMLRKTVMVRQGEMVSITVTNGGVSLRTHLKAEGDGAIGEYVTMENPTSGRLITAQVTGKDSAHIELSNDQQVNDDAKP